MKKVFALLLVAGLLGTLTGCQLAREEGAEPGAGDQLIGGVVTVGSISTFDVEAYLNAHPEVLLYGDGEPIQDNSQPIYAEVEFRTQEDGTTQEIYTFPDIEGILFYDVVDYDKEINAVCADSGPNEGVTDHKVGIHVQEFDWETGESTQTIEISGTVNYDATKTPEVFFLNPIYQTEDGTVYLMPGGPGVSGEYDGTGIVFSSEYRQEEETVEGTTTTTAGTTITATLQFRFPAESIRLIQMDRQNRMLDQMEFQPGQAPETLTPAAETAYILVEYCCKNSPEVDRELIPRREESLTTYVLQPSGFFHTQTTQLLWEQEGGTQ